MAVADEQRDALAQDMARRSVTVCEDKTLYPQIFLVAGEPVSASFSWSSARRDARHRPGRQRCKQPPQ